MEETNRSLKISGVTRASGGQYDDVQVQGVGRIHGDLECNRCRVEGVADVSGNVHAKEIDIQGKSTVKGNVTGEDVKIEGQLNVSGNLDAETFFANGTFNIAGLLNAGEISIRLYGPTKAKEIGGENIRIEKGYGFGFFGRFKKLSAESIEGDNIHLVNTTAKVVRGNHVWIGPGCDIETVEYRNECHEDKAARVKESKQL